MPMSVGGAGGGAGRSGLWRLVRRGRSGAVCVPAQEPGAPESGHQRVSIHTMCTQYEYPVIRYLPSRSCSWARPAGRTAAPQAKSSASSPSSVRILPYTALRSSRIPVIRSPMCRVASCKRRARRCTAALGWLGLPREPSARASASGARRRRIRRRAWSRSCRRARRRRRRRGASRECWSRWRRVRASLAHGGRWRGWAPRRRTRRAARG